MICWKCKKEINVEEIFRTTECPLCKAELHVCKGCKFYSSGSHFDCKETIEDLVADKERSNFCDHFSANKNIAAGSGDKSKSDAARDAFNALFGGGICL